MSVRADAGMLEIKAKSLKVLRGTFKYTVIINSRSDEKKQFDVSFTWRTVYSENVFTTFLLNSRLIRRISPNSG